MDSQTNQSSMQEASATMPLKKKRGRKPMKDRQLKVNGRDRRIRLSVKCAELVFELQKKLGHKKTGQTVQWVLEQAWPAIDALPTTNTNPSFMNPIMNWDAYSVDSSNGFIDPYAIPYQTPMVSMAPMETTTDMTPMDPMEPMETTIDMKPMVPMAPMETTTDMTRMVPMAPMETTTDMTPMVPVAPVETTTDMTFPIYINEFTSDQDFVAAGTSGLAASSMPMEQSIWDAGFLDDIELSNEDISEILADL